MYVQGFSSMAFLSSMQLNLFAICSNSRAPQDLVFCVLTGTGQIAASKEVVQGWRVLRGASSLLKTSSQCCTNAKSCRHPKQAPSLLCVMCFRIFMHSKLTHLCLAKSAKGLRLKPRSTLQLWFRHGLCRAMMALYLIGDCQSGCS